MVGKPRSLCQGRVCRPNDNLIWEKGFVSSLYAFAREKLPRFSRSDGIKLGASKGVLLIYSIHAFFVDIGHCPTKELTI